MRNGPSPTGLLRGIVVRALAWHSLCREMDPVQVWSNAFH